MDIFNEEPRKIKCTSNHNHLWGNCDDASQHLVVGKEYSLNEVERHDWHTRIYLDEFHLMCFSSVCFEEIN